MPIKANNPKLAFQEIFMLLMRIAKIYQIPNWDNTNAELLTEWLIDEYQHHNLELVSKTLRNPPKLNDTAWRLTPDTLREWIDYTRNKEADLKIRIDSEKRQDFKFDTPDDMSDETKAMIQEYINSLSGFKQVQAMSEADVKKYGRERPVQKLPESLGYVPPNKEYLIEKELRRRWALEVFDKVTGKANENYLSFEEWKLI